MISGRRMEWKKDSIQTKASCWSKLPTISCIFKPSLAVGKPSITDLWIDIHRATPFPQYTDIPRLLGLFLLRGDQAGQGTLAAPCAHGADGEHRDDRLDLGVPGAETPEVRSAEGTRCEVHQGLMRNVAVGKNNDVELPVLRSVSQDHVPR